MRTLSGINLDDFELMTKSVFPRLYKQKAVIDIYLREIVFPRGAKEFESKLSSSGWDIAEKRDYPSTGFSGTNDNRFLLPLTIKQNDLQENWGTNAKVLGFLLQEENNFYASIPVGEDKFEALKGEILRQETARPIRVIIDVGAQILLDNVAVAENLLAFSRQHPALPQAVVYFSELDEILVQTTDGTVAQLLYSPFVKQLDKCFVYLDEVHTRGTDLKLPAGTRAAVTLGPRLMKDRLVQGEICLPCWLELIANGICSVYAIETVGFNSFPDVCGLWRGP